MTTEVKRNTWSRFCRKFNLVNQYRSANVTIKQQNRKSVEVDRDAAFLGVTVTKKGRFIDGIAMFLGRHNPDELKQPVFAIKEPVKVELAKDNQGQDARLSIQAKDGTVASVVLSGDKDPNRYYSLVEKVAYSLYERRGASDGGHVDDWLEAERQIKETELQLTQ